MRGPAASPGVHAPGGYSVAVAPGHASGKWRNKKMAWVEFVAWQREPRRTGETCAEYRSLPKAAQGDVKNGECYVAGYLKGGVRRKGSVQCRSMVVLDADSADADLWADYGMLIGSRACMYPTHSHTEAAPKYRLVIPLAREVSAEEYVPLALKVAEVLGFKRFDPTTYQPERLMYKSSCCKDAPFELFECSGAPLDPDRWLAMYADWRDVSCWPVQGLAQARRTAKAPDPRDKRGIIGAFCRVYPVEAAIGEFLAGAYGPGPGGRHTYRGGTAFGGVVCYEGLWAYSNHATDPASGRLCNAFDLCRIHLFGELDAEEGEGAAVTSLPSYRAATAWAMGLEPVGAELARASAQEAAEEFAEEPDPEDDAWLAKLAKDPRTGLVLPTAGNLGTIFRRDKNIAGRLRRDVESDAVYAVADRLPWRTLPRGYSLWSDGDDASLRIYLEVRYGITGKAKIDDAVSHAADAAPYDPVMEYLGSLPVWDGVGRVDTLLIDLMGARDDDYTRAVTRKTLCAAVRRARVPGCKHDYMLILEGVQGLGKSTLLAKLAGEWFTDALSLADIGQPKVAAEKLQGTWIAEVAELDGLAKASIERLKSFLSTATDNYRAAYARRAGRYKRRCIIVGTVNNLDGYLRDATGNRRFWPVRLTRRLDHRRLDAAAVAQIWAEAAVLEAKGEALYLAGEVERTAQIRQREAMETDPRESIIHEYLEAPVPPGFASWTLSDREGFWAAREDFDGRKGCNQTSEKGNQSRETVSIIEVWHECLGQSVTKPTRLDSYQLSAALKKLGWVPTGGAKKLRAYGTVKTYERGENGNQQV